ncbi:MAG TPA: hypothetical protein VGK87_04245 [Anaerolineae bacterium]|jgi:H+/Cl- antiporter ClcA
MRKDNARFLIIAAAASTVAALMFAAPTYSQSILPPPPYRIDDLKPAMLSAAAAAGISLIFRYVPGARDWFGQLQPEYKQWCMFALAAVIAIAIGTWEMAANGFTQDALVRLLFTLFTALTSNQVTYQFIRK